MAKKAVKELGAMALKLPPADRASLVGILIHSLVSPEDEVWQAWLDEAERRDHEMDEDPSVGIPAHLVLQRAHARLS